MNHLVKCTPAYFAAILDGCKPFDVRKNDRDYRVNDTLSLNEWAPPEGTDPRACVTAHYTGRQAFALITYVYDGRGMTPGYVALGLRRQLR